MAARLISLSAAGEPCLDCGLRIADGAGAQADLGRKRGVVIAGAGVHQLVQRRTAQTSALFKLLHPEHLLKGGIFFQGKLHEPTELWS